MSTPCKDTTLIRASNLRASYGAGDLRVPVLDGASFEIERSGVTAIVGPSGSGKTTLLSLLGGLDRADQGSIVVDGQELTTLGRAGLGRYRRRQVGFVFQSFNLLPTLNARENVEAGLEPLGMGRREARACAAEALARVGLEGKAQRFPHELSGGEQQRVAVARACAKNPPLLLADEPTGNLDEEVGAQVLDLLLGLSESGDAPRTLVVVTHDPLVAARADRRLTLSNHQVHTS